MTCYMLRQAKRRFGEPRIRATPGTIHSYGASKNSNYQSLSFQPCPLNKSFLLIKIIGLHVNHSYLSMVK